jgi:hypothetical protein
MPHVVGHETGRLDEGAWLVIVAVGLGVIGVVLLVADIRRRS